MTPNITITAKQIRFLSYDGAGVSAVLQLHVPGGVPKELRGAYCVPLEEHRRYGWGNLSGQRELAIFRSWGAAGYKL